MTTRRQLLLALGGVFFAAPLGSSAQQKEKVWRVGFVSSRARPDDPDSDYHLGLPRGLRELGYVEGKNLIIEWRFADGQYARFPDLVTELIRIPVDIIVTDGTPTTLAAQKVTKAIPIVFGSAGDPVGNGLVESLARPGGNTTGISLLSDDTSAKQIELLFSMVPRLTRVAVLMNPDNPAARQLLKGVQAAAQATRVELLPIEARSQQEIENAFSLMVKGRAGAFIFLPDSFLYQHRRLMAELALKNRLPGMSSARGFPAAGGLMGYGQNLEYNYRRAAVYVDKILKGTKPADLPVEQPTKLDLVVNRKTARAMGLEIPPDLLVLTAEVID